MKNILFAFFSLLMLNGAAMAQENTSKYAIFETTQGTFVMELAEKEAPKHVASIRKLITEGFYTNIPFHRVVPDFVAQAGDGTLLGKPRPDWGLPLEISSLKHTRGALGAARLGHDRNSASTQFYVVLKDAPFLNGEYTVFGKVVQGMEAVDKLTQSDTIKQATLSDTLPQ